MILTVIFMAVPAAAQAAGEISDGETADLLTQIKQQLSAAFEEMDQETAEEVFLSSRISSGKRITHRRKDCRVS